MILFNELHGKKWYRYNNLNSARRGNNFFIILFAFNLCIMSCLVKLQYKLTVIVIFSLSMFFLCSLSPHCVTIKRAYLILKTWLHARHTSSRLCKTFLANFVQTHFIHIFTFTVTKEWNTEDYLFSLNIKEFVWCIVEKYNCIPRRDWSTNKYLLFRMNIIWM